MCFFKDKWPKKVKTEEEQKQEQEYIKATAGIKNIGDLIEFIKPFKYVSDIKDNPEVPIWKKDITNDFKKVTGQEIMDFLNIKKGELDLLDGSPPCQGFSTAGKRQVVDSWQPPYKTYHLKNFDCEDMAIMIQEILHRCLGIENPWFVIYGGYFLKAGKRTYSEHAVCIFENSMQMNYYEFTNKTYREAYNPINNNIMLYGYKHYPEGLKYYERRNTQGKIVDKKRAWIGYIK